MSRVCASCWNVTHTKTSCHLITIAMGITINPILIPIMNLFNQLYISAQISSLKLSKLLKQNSKETANSRL